jgi:hypothetical protein
MTTFGASVLVAQRFANDNWSERQNQRFTRMVSRKFVDTTTIVIPAGRVGACESRSHENTKNNLDSRFRGNDENGPRLCQGSYLAGSSATLGDRIAGRIGLRCNQRPERVGVFEPGAHHVFGDLIKFQCFF